MKKLFMRLGAFSCAAILSFLLADYLYSLVFRHANEGNMEVWRDVMTGKASADILICGDSRVNTDCYPPVIDSVTGLTSYDLGVMGHHFSGQKIRYDMYRKYNDPPKVVVQFVDNWLFLPLSPYDKRQFLPWMWDPAFCRSALSVEPSYFVSKSIPWIRYRGSLLSDVDWSGRKTERGFFSYEHDGDFARMSDEKLEFKEYPRYARLFRSFVKDLKDEGIGVVLVLAPLYQSRLYDKDLVDRLRERLTSEARENGVELLDYLQMPFCDDMGMFLDGIHLSMEGAKAFSDTLANDLIRIGLLRK